MSVARSVQTVGLEEHRSMARTWPSVAEFGRISIISITITLESKACLRNIKKEKEVSVWSLFTHRVVPTTLRSPSTRRTLLTQPHPLRGLERLLGKGAVPGPPSRSGPPAAAQ